MKNLTREVIRPSEIYQVYGISKSTAYRMMKQGLFPKLNSLSPRCKGWKKSEFDAHFGIAA
jgi:predicted DNA-binding transcriptional regulator AlpA